MASKLRPDILIGLGFAYAVTALFKYTAILGAAPGAQFSWAHCVLPLFGAFCGIAGSGALFAGHACMRMASFALGARAFTFLGLPTVCASLFWSGKGSSVRVFMPLVCILLFAIHPIGSCAIVYTLYWFIPIIIGLCALNHPFLLALGSTFTAHAVGSVMHLYMFAGLTATDWLRLIPQVAIERLSFALCMWMLYEIIAYVCVMHTATVKKVSA